MTRNSIQRPHVVLMDWRSRHPTWGRSTELYPFRPLAAIAAAPRDGRLAVHQQGTASRGKGPCIIYPRALSPNATPGGRMIHDPSPKFAGAGTVPLLSEASSNLRHNQYAPSCQPSGPQSEPAQHRVNIKGAGSAQNYMLGQSSEIYDQGPGSRESSP